MNALIQSGAISEIKGSQNVAYILNNEDLFLLTGYKVLKSQEKNGFIKCAKLKYNGKIKLLYFTSSYKNLKDLMPSIGGDTFLTIIANLLNAVIEIKNNGFLICPNLDLSFDKIFVDPKTLAVNLVYLPINNPSVDVATFENELRTQLIKLITTTPSLSTPNISAACTELSNGSLSLNDLYQKIRALCNGGGFSNGYSGNNHSSDHRSGSQPEMIIETINSSTKIQFSINKKEFVIGKRASAVDGPITTNKVISNLHCKITYENNEYSVVDLSSTNGTYVNKEKLTPYQSVPIKNGDILRLANIDFKVQI